ncbi:MAG: hypothetical protein V1837_05065 [Candidatus Woesearchaeota archaeon]
MSDIADSFLSFFTGTKEELLQNFEVKVTFTCGLVELCLAVSGFAGEELSTYLFVDNHIRLLRTFGSAAKNFMKLGKFYDCSLVQPGLVGTIREITTYLTEDTQYQPAVQPTSFTSGLTLDRIE